MILGRVVGTVVSTIKHPAYSGMKLLLVRAIRLEGGLADEEILAVDRAQAGVGDLVLILKEGSGVRQIWLGDPAADQFPVLETIVAVVDSVEGPLKAP